MALYKFSFPFLGALMSVVFGNLHYNQFKSFGLDGGTDNSQKLWFADDYLGQFYKSESQVVPHYVSSSYDNLKHETKPIPSAIGLGVKKIPKKDKDLKKNIKSFYSLSNNDNLKFKEKIFKSNAPYCQEINTKNRKTDLSLSVMSHKHIKCYRCKDPKNGASYEHCSYTSQLPQSNSQEARSNAGEEKTLDNLSAAATQYSNSNQPTSDKLPEAFRFSDDYFQPEASHDLPAEYEKNIDNCERIIKDSMICMICKDSKTNGKYEQCSYVAQPNEKAFAYTKSSSFGPTKNKNHEQPQKEIKKKSNKPTAHPKKKDDDEREYDTEHQPYRHRESEELAEREEIEKIEDESTSSEDKEGLGSHYVPEHTYHYPSYQDYKSSYDNYEPGEEEEDSSSKQSSKLEGNCKTLEKDGQTCTVCTNPKTGGKSENCNYSYEPKDKIYKYSKSKSFGYPQSEKSTEGEGDDDREKTAESSVKQERESSADDYGSYASEPSTLDYIRSESEKISEKVKGKGECRKVKKDSMICTICKDAQSGGDFEQCNYSYDPDDKIYAYSKSSSFGSPTKTSNEDDYANGSGEEHPEETYSAPVIYPTGTSPLDYIPKTKNSDSYLSSVYTTKKPQVQTDGKQEESQEKISGSKVDSGFYDATMRRAAIEKIVKDMESEDRSKCKKTIRGSMTCFKCIDNKGFMNEECVYVTEPEVEASKEKSIQVADTTATTKATVESTEDTTTSTTEKLLEPLTSATNWKSVITNRKIREAKEKAKDPDEELEMLDEEQHEAEPYDFVAETRPVYDKVLGITLPAYMLQKSSHEIEFDTMVENSTF